MTSWLPLISALVIAAVTYRGIRMNIAASNHLEHAKWQRETIMRLSSEALATTHAVNAELSRLMAGREIKSRTDLHSCIASIQAHGRQLALNGNMIEMLDAEPVALACRELQSSVFADGLIGAATQLGAVDSEDHPLKRDRPPTAEYVERWSKTYDAGLERISESMAKLILASQAELRKIDGSRRSHATPIRGILWDSIRGRA